MNSSLSEAFERRVGRRVDFRQSVLTVSRLPYERPSVLSPEAVVAEWRGTCSSKHLLLRALAHERWPHLCVEIWHRVYEVTQQLACERWGNRVAETVPRNGLVDVHSYLTAHIQDREVVVDATFPIADWDGASDLPLWCGPGIDYAAGLDPIGSKARLTLEHCDPAIREPFIAALTRATNP